MRWPPTSKQLALAAASTTVSLFLCAWILSLRGEPSTVELVDSREEVQELFESRGAAERLEESGANARETEAVLRHWPLTASEATKMFASLGNKKNKRFIVDPQTYFWVQPSQHRMMYFTEYPTKRMRVDTNAMGFRKDVEMQDPAPDLRILVTGDSHTEGVVANDELFTERLEETLRQNDAGRSVEVLNAGKGGYSFYNYVGVLEKFADLQPDLFIVTVYGGNDFVESVRPRSFFEGLPQPPPIRRKWQRLLGPDSEAYTPLVSQFLYQALNLQSSTQSRDLARAASQEAVSEIARLCEQRGIEFLLVYLPPASDVQPIYVETEVNAVNALADLGPGAFELADTLASELLEHCEARAIRALDLRPAFRAEDEFLYWKKDHHINIRGHQKVADALAPMVESIVAK